MNELQQRIFSHEGQDEPRKWDDRRRDPRAQAPRPVYVQPADPRVEEFEEVRTMTNFSRNGFYFITERPSYSPGMRLYVIPAFGHLNLEYVGAVMRVEELSVGEYGIAVRLLHIRNSSVRTPTVAVSAFQSFALADHTAETLPQTDPECSLLPPGRSTSRS